MYYPFQGREIAPAPFIKEVWPDVTLYNKQYEILDSIVANDDTIVPAGNMLGKDFICGLGVLYVFLTRNPCRVVTTSVDQSQLEKVLWGEIANFISTAKYELPLIVNHCDIKKMLANGRKCPKSYIIGRVAKTEEGLLGHHLPRGPRGEPRTWMFYDEASGIEGTLKDKTDTWAHRTVVIGNPYECNNFFKKAVETGDIPRDDARGGYYQKIIQIKAIHSPNVRLGLAEVAAGLAPSHKQLVQGVLSYADYLKRVKMWDDVRKCISLEAEFYRGASALLYPTEWLNLAHKRHLDLVGTQRRGRAIGIDPAEGGDKTSMSCVDEYGLIEQVAKKTPNTAVITGEAIAFWEKHGVSPENVLFDRGGGGKQHADRLREQGYPVRTVGFGEPATYDDLEKFKYGMRQKEEQREESEEKYTYVNRRAEMYGLIRKLLDPTDPIGFALPPKYIELRRQMAPIPLEFDREGRMKVMSKNKPSKDSKEMTLKELLGCSPDELDSLALAVYGLHNQAKVTTVGAF